MISLPATPSAGAAPPWSVRRIRLPFGVVVPLPTLISAPLDLFTLAARLGLRADRLLDEYEDVLHDIAPLLRDTALLREELTPALREAAPALRALAPALEEVAPVLRQAAPLLRELVPVLQAATPALRALAPLGNELVPVLQDATPGLRALAPLLDDAAPALRTLTPALAQAAPVLVQLIAMWDRIGPALEQLLPLLAEPVEPRLKALGDAVRVELDKINVIADPELGMAAVAKNTEHLAVLADETVERLRALPGAGRLLRGARTTTDARPAQPGRRDRRGTGPPG